MLGDRDLRGTIVKAIDKVYNDFYQKEAGDNPDRIHAGEACTCIRLSYYERKDPLPWDTTSKVSILIHDSFRRLLKNVRGEYRVDNLVIDVTADMIVNEEFVIRFELVSNIPEVPHPRDLLYLNACLFAFNKSDGILIYITSQGRTAEFSITKNGRMVEQVIRRARVLSTLLKDGKVPIVEPSDLCFGCKYYERCYSKEKKISDGVSLESIFGFGKK